MILNKIVGAVRKQKVHHTENSDQTDSQENKYAQPKVVSETTKEKLCDFVKHSGLGDWENKTDEDKQKFYEFIREAHEQGDLNMPLEDFAEIIRSVDEYTQASDELIQEFYDKYHKGIEILLLRI